MQHKSPTNNRAKAPYNFVPLPKMVLQADEPPPRDCYHDGKFTGYIELKIKTETPLYTRCAFPPTAWSDPAKLEKGSPKVTQVRECQDFFHRGDTAVPVIPGSTLRGMTRSLVEILSYSKIGFVSNKKLIHRSLADSTLGKKYRDQLFDKIKGGYLVKENGDYKIRPAVEKNGRTFVLIPFSRKGNDSPYFTDVFSKKSFQKNRHKSYTVWVKPQPNYSKTNEICFDESQIPDNEKQCYFKAKLVVSGDMFNRRDEAKSKQNECAVFEADKNAESIPISDEFWRLFQDDLALSRKTDQKPRKLTNFTDGEPVFYLINEDAEKPEEKLVFFGLAKMFRLPFTSRIHDFLDDDSKNREISDIAESIFGSVNEKNKKAQAGRVFFTDAICTTEDAFFQNDRHGRFVPKILSSPKPTAFQLYLNQPEPNSSKTLKSYYDKGKTQVRGFKRYWHKKEVPVNNTENGFVAESKFIIIDGQGVKNTQDQKESKQHTIIRPVKKGVEFNKCKVYFENLSNVELGALLTALDLPEGKRHQIGMAKPYGLGSIEIKPTLVLESRRKRYESLFDGNNWAMGKDDSLIEDFKKDFADKIIEFHNTKICQNDAVESLEEIPRLKQLFTMLEWDDPKEMGEKVYVGFEDRNERQWKDRYVLPFPQHVESGKSGAVEPCIFQSPKIPVSQNADNSDETAPVEEVIEPPQAAPRSEAERQQAEEQRSNHLENEISGMTVFDKKIFKEIGRKIVKHKLSKAAAALIAKVEELGAFDEAADFDWYWEVEDVVEESR